MPCPAPPVPTPDEQLARFDNNIGQRNVAPIAGGGGLTGLLGSFVNRNFWTNNPYPKEIRVDLQVDLPLFLTQRGWQVVFLNPGGASFTFPARGSRKIQIGLKPGGEFTASDVIAAGKHASIVVSAKTDGYVFGGITYQIDPALKTPPMETLPGSGSPRMLHERLTVYLECLHLPCGQVKSVCIKKVTIDIELKSCDC